MHALIKKELRLLIFVEIRFMILLVLVSMSLSGSFPVDLSLIASGHLKILIKYNSSMERIINFVNLIGWTYILIQT